MNKAVRDKKYIYMEVWGYEKLMNRSTGFYLQKSWLRIYKSILTVNNKKKKHDVFFVYSMNLVVCCFFCLLFYSCRKN